MGNIGVSKPTYNDRRISRGMTSGRLGIVACPMLEDELIGSLGDDPEKKRVIVLDTPYNDSLKRKLQRKGVPFEEIDETDFMNGWVDIDPSEYNVIVKMNDLGLHAEPVKLKEFISDELIMLQGRVDAVGLYYGMCGNYGWDITKWAEDHLPFRVEVFRDCNGRVCDDCIGTAVGGLAGYQRLLKEFTGMLLLTPAVATNWYDFLKAGDIGKGLGLIPSSGDPKKDMKDLLIMCGYNSAVQIDTGLEDRKEFDESARDLVDFMEFKLYQAPPDIIDLGPMHRLYAKLKEDLEEASHERW